MAEVTVKNAQGDTVLRTGPRRFQQDVVTDDEVEQIASCVDGHMIRPFLSLVMALMTVLVMGFLTVRQNKANNK